VERHATLESVNDEDVAPFSVVAKTQRCGFDFSFRVSGKAPNDALQAVNSAGDVGFEIVNHVEMVVLAAHDGGFSQAGEFVGDGFVVEQALEQDGGVFGPLCLFLFCAVELVAGVDAPVADADAFSMSSLILLSASARGMSRPGRFLDVPDDFFAMFSLGFPVKIRRASPVHSNPF